MTDTREDILEPTAAEIERVAKGIAKGIYGHVRYWESYTFVASAAILAMDRRASPPAPAVAVPEGASTRDWTEDFAHENGRYMCRCHACGQQFEGHKRRVTCKVCAAAPTPPAAEAPGQEPVAWQVHDYADSWITYYTELGARSSEEAKGGATVRPLYAAPPTYADAEAMGHWQRQAEAAQKNVALFQQDCALHVAEKEGLRAKLAPFVALAKRMLDKDIPRHVQEDESTPVLSSGVVYEDADAVVVTVGDLRRAAAIRSLASPAPKGEGQ